MRARDYKGCSGVVKGLVDTPAPEEEALKRAARQEGRGRAGGRAVTGGKLEAIEGEEEEGARTVNSKPTGTCWSGS